MLGASVGSGGADEAGAALLAAACEKGIDVRLPHPHPGVDPAVRSGRVGRHTTGPAVDRLGAVRPRWARSSGSPVVGCGGAGVVR